MSAREKDKVVEALIGHEIEVLDALKIPWRDGRPHIRCPYPDHDDHDPSWRWDKDKARAHCTCSGGSENIVGVLMKTERLDYPAARERAARIIGRTDLIEDSAPHDAKWHLKPPPELCDSGLPRAYLAHRLRVEPVDVIMPTTAAVGWRALPYWDKPADGGKFERIGDFPCAVFELVNPGGLIHAHRIYLQPGGAGKATLPRRADGEARDPKKSVRLPPGIRIGGRCVYWGNPDTAELALVGEGVETMQAVAQAYAVEITTGTVMVVAAISTSWMQTWQPWPATRRIVICADRDDAKSGTAKKAGEKAAKKLAERLGADVAVSIALPGAPGANTDMLDVWLRDGAAAVRHLVKEAAPWTPEPVVDRPPAHGDLVPLPARQADAEDAAKPVILLAGGELPRVVDEAEAALLAMPELNIW